MQILDGIHSSRPFGVFTFLTYVSLVPIVKMMKNPEASVATRLLGGYLCGCIYLGFNYRIAP